LHGAAGGPGEFSLYVLALSWAPEFCAAHGDKGECSPLSDFASTHLTIHGLWPNYDDSQSASMGCEYPQYCDDTAGCAVRNPPDSCNPSASSIPAIMSKYGPGYVSDHDFLANHEWPKHGVCSGLGEADYFASAVTALTGRGDSGTPAALASAIGGAISPAALKGAFHVASSILLSCDAQCTSPRLASASRTMVREADRRGGVPENATTSASDNGCVTRQCATIHVRTLAQASGGPPADQRPVALARTLARARL